MFAKGQSGNPGGRPKDTVRPLAVAKSKVAFEKLVKLLDSQDENIVFKASLAIIERAFGKPLQEMPVIENHVHLTTVQQLHGALRGGLKHGLNHDKKEKSIGSQNGNRPADGLRVD